MNIIVIITVIAALFITDPGALFAIFLIVCSIFIIQRKRILSSYFLPKVATIFFLLGISFILLLRIFNSIIVENQQIAWLLHLKIPILFITLGAFVILYIKNNNRILKKIENEHHEEKHLLGERKKYFQEKFTNLKKIPIFGKILETIHQNGYLYSAVVCILITIGFFIRFYRLGELSLWGDEYVVFNATQNILDHGIPQDIGSEYIKWRGLTYHYFTALCTWLFGWSEWVIRTPNVFFGMGIALISFLFTRSINRHLALAVLFFMVFSPYNIEYSRFARFYTLNALLFLLEIFFVYKGFFQNLKKYKIIAVITGVIMVHTVQLGSIFALIIAAYFLYDFLKTRNIKVFIQRNNINFIYLCTSLIIAAVGNIPWRFFNVRYEYLGAINQNIPNMYQWSYFQAPDFTILQFLNQHHISIVFIFISLISLFLWRKNTFLSFINMAFIVSIVSYSILSRGKNGARLFFMWESLHTLFSFLGVFWVLQLLNISRIKQKIALFLCSSLLVFSVTPHFGKQITLGYGADLSKNPFKSSNTAIYRSDEKNTYKFLAEHIGEDDIWIAVVSGSFYTKRNPDYIFDQSSRWNSLAVATDTLGNFLDRNGSILINQLNDIFAVLEKYPDKRVWITVKGSVMRVARSSGRILNDFREFSKEHYDKIVYASPDGVSNVMLFE